RQEITVEVDDAVKQCDTNQDGAVDWMDAHASHDSSSTLPGIFETHGRHRGDVDLSGVVDVIDQGAVISNYGSSNATYSLGDLNFDGVVDSTDLIIVFQEVNQVSSVAPAQSLSLLVSAPSVTSSPVVSSYASKESANGKPTITVRDSLRSLYDDDNDGLPVGAELRIGTDPNNWDSDGDFLQDGFEFRSATLDPLAANSLDPNVANSIHADPDSDSLSYYDEQAHGTDPNSPDTDGDGVRDNDEISQHRSPTNPNDAEWADDDTVLLSLSVGDGSPSDSETYDMTVGDVTFPGYGGAQNRPFVSGTFRFAKGDTYDVELLHRGSTLAEPDYDYGASISMGGNPLDGMVVIEDSAPTTPEYPQINYPETTGILRNGWYAGGDFALGGGPFIAEGVTAKAHVPKINIVAIGSDGLELSEKDETTIGAFVQLNSDDDDNDGIQDLLDPFVAGGDDDLLEVRIEQLLPERLRDLPGHILLSVPANLNLWADRQKSVQFYDNHEFSLDSEHTLFVEGSSLWGSGGISVEYVPLFEENPDFKIFGFERDSLTVNSQSLDLELNSVSNEWEDSPGVLIWRNSDYSRQVPSQEQPEPNLTKFRPDYETNSIATSELGDFASATLRLPHRTVGSEVEITFPNDVRIWWVDAQQFGPDVYHTVVSGERFNPNREYLELYVEGVSLSTAFAADSIQAQFIAKNGIVAAGGEWVDKATVTVVDTHLGVDGNRDRQIDFTNSHDTQMLFWYNNDREELHDGFMAAPIERENTNVTSLGADNVDLDITHRRDIEDFAAMRLSVSPILKANTFDRALLPNSTPGSAEIQVEFRMQLVDNGFLSSSITLYNSHNESSDVNRHISDEATIDGQVNNQPFRTALGSIPSGDDMQLGGLLNGENAFLFEANGPTYTNATRPAAIPSVVFSSIVTYPDGTSHTYSRRVDLELHHVKSLYSRYDIDYRVGAADLRKDISFQHFSDAAITHSSKIKDTDYRCLPNFETLLSLSTDGT
ncbi:hypothetical protein ACFL2H_10565, partial [Planctomycetota bacterium]